MFKELVVTTSGISHISCKEGLIHQAENFKRCYEMCNECG